MVIVALFFAFGAARGYYRAYRMWRSPPKWRLSTTDPRTLAGGSTLFLLGSLYCAAVACLHGHDPLYFGR
jgi:hypothetical protein